MKALKCETLGAIYIFSDVDYLAKGSGPETETTFA